MLWSIDTCQYKVSPDQRHMTILQLKFKTHQVPLFFFKLTADQAQCFFLVELQAHVR